MMRDRMSVRAVASLALGLLRTRDRTIGRLRDELVEVRRELRLARVEAARWEERAESMRLLEESSSGLASARADQLRALGVWPRPEVAS